PGSIFFMKKVQERFLVGCNTKDQVIFFEIDSVPGQIRDEIQVWVAFKQSVGKFFVLFVGKINGDVSIMQVFTEIFELIKPGTTIPDEKDLFVIKDENAIKGFKRNFREVRYDSFKC